MSMSRDWARDPRDGSSWPRLFTIEEANDLLPEIVPLIMEMRARKVALDSALAALEQLVPAMRLNGHAAEARAARGPHPRADGGARCRHRSPGSTGGGGQEP